MNTSKTPPLEFEEDSTPTQRIYGPVADNNHQHLRAFSDLRDSMSRGDLDGAAAAQAEIKRIEQESKKVHADALNYLVRQRRMFSQNSDTI